MVTVFQQKEHAAGGHSAVGPSPDGTGYTSYKEPDTRVPPKPLPVMKAIRVDGVEIPESAILREAQNHPARNPGEALRAAATALAIRQLLLNEAERLGFAKKGVAEADGSGTPDDAAIQLLLDSEVTAPKAGEAECRRFYDNNPDRFMSPVLYEARHILIAAKEDDDHAREAAHMLATELCSALIGRPGWFAEMAKAHSVCPSAGQGGNLGQLSPRSTVPEFESALEAMVEGEISRAPVASRFGYHIIALDRRIEPRRLPFEAVHGKIAVWLEAQAWSRASAQYVQILAGRAKIEGIDISGSESPLVQ